jgi:uncharacterized membrane protein
MAQAAKRGEPGERLKSEVMGLAEALAARGISAARNRVGGTVSRLTDYTENGGGPGLMAAVTGVKDIAEGKSPTRALLGAGMSGLKQKVSGLFGGKGKGKGGRRQKLKVTNIVESIDVGVPLRVAYDQWTQFSQFPAFMKKVENVEQAEDQKLNWKAQVFWSHRTWEATIIDQRPDERIVWRSKGAKGHVDGAVTFHELAPSLTRIVLVLEYHPQGLFEHTGNIWRAQGRRARLELKHFRRHVMTNTILRPDELEGWRGVIEDGKVVKDQDTALQEEQEAGEPSGEEARGEEPVSEEQEEQEAAAETPAGDDSAEEEVEEEEAPASGRTRRAAPRRQRGSRTAERTRSTARRDTA